MRYQPLGTHLRAVCSDALQITLTLFKILIPALIIVRLLDQLGLIALLGQLLAAPMDLLDLPPMAGLIWATAMLTNIYAGMILVVTYGSSWSLEQITLLGVMMLGAHNLLVELSVAHRAGCRVIPQLLMRILGTYTLAWILHQLYQHSAAMQAPVALFWQPEIHSNDWGSWLKTQLVSLFWTAVIIFGLVSVIRVMKITGLERLLERLLEPALKLIGISKSALSMALIGITLGLAYGGGLLIREAEQGRVKPPEVFAAITLLGLCHSLIEDTLLIALIGADLSGILWARLVWGLLLIAILTRLLAHCPNEFIERFLVRKPARSVRS